MQNPKKALVIMAEDKNGHLTQLKQIIEAEMKYADRFKLQYFEHETFEKVSAILSKMRSERILDGDQYHLLFSIYKRFYTNSIKYKSLLASQPRYIAQLFIGKKEVRRKIFDRDKRCLCCGSEEYLTLDHIVPVSRNGLNEIENLQTLCRSCNSRKMNKIIDYRKNT